jgi:hypothetical protein
MSLLGFPLLIVPFALYNIAAFLLQEPSSFWTSAAATLPMMTGEPWIVTWEDLIIAFSIFLLWIEVIKSTRMGIRAIIDHTLAMLLFVAMLIEFLMVKAAGTSTFFLLVFISLVDVLAGFIISIRSAQRQVSLEGPDKV